MIPMKRRLAKNLLPVFLFFSCYLPAQTGGFKVIAGSDTVAPGAHLCIPVTVQDFDCIVGFQFSLSWDPQVLTFQYVQGFNLPYLSVLSFGGNNLAGVSTVFWYDDSPSLNGVALPDGATLYEACFLAIGPGGSSTPMVISDIGFTPGSMFMEALNCLGNDVWNDSSAVNGTVLIQDDVNAVSTGPVSEKQVLQITPNPFSSGTQITFALAEPGPVQVRITDISGKIILEEKRQGSAGENNMNISGDQLPVAGFYRVLVNTAKQCFTRSICYFKK